MIRTYRSATFCSYCLGEGVLNVPYPPEDYVGGVMECTVCHCNGWYYQQVEYDDSVVIGKKADLVIMDDVAVSY